MQGVFVGEGLCPWMGVHVLQLTALTFVPAAWMAWAVGRSFGALVIGCTTLTSLHVHRRVRAETWDAVDYLDVGSLWLWVAYNACVVVEVVTRLMTVFCAAACGCLVAALLGAAGCAHFERARQCGDQPGIEWRSPTNVRRHACLHLCGGVGSVFLVFAAGGGGTTRHFLC